MRGPRDTQRKLSSVLGQAEKAIDDAIDADLTEDDIQQIVYAKLPPELTEKQWEAKIRPLYIEQWDTVEKIWNEEDQVYFARLTFTPKITEYNG